VLGVCVCVWCGVHTHT